MEVKCTRNEIHVIAGYYYCTHALYGQVAFIDG